ncbi:FtsX-like permease family protein [Thalassococcus sp. S3]|uniref:FtsX-like permease family protein n=1 Tax=Thalassococcus sp. S3 TaxID=2017482 RepID=UPI001023FCF6|nr:ABC transporter permease [Thalassococcus sp. S3]QBF31175.1 ABC transporter permease [Thalassococcus sp. S3]
MIRTGLIAILSHWRKRPWQLLTLVLGLALATALWSGVQAINAEARASYAEAADVLDQGRYARIVTETGAPIPEPLYVALRRAGWLVSPVVEGRVGGRSLLGVDLLTLPRQAQAGPAAPPDLTRLLSGGPVVFAHPDDAEEWSALGIEVVSDTEQSRGTALADIGTVQNLTATQGALSYLLVAPAQPRLRAPLSQIDARLVLQEPEQAQADMARLTDSFHLNLTAFGLLSFAVGIFIVYGAIGLAFEQRRPIFRTLRALGMPLRALIIVLGLELMALALVAGAVGVALGYVVAAALLPDVAATLRGLYGADVPGQLSLRPIWWVSGLGMALLGSSVAALGAFWRLARLPVLASNQPRAWTVQAARAGLWFAAASLMLAGLGIAIAAFGSGLIAGFGLLACLLLAAALALPPVLDLVLRGLATLARGPMGAWFWADARQQLPGLSMALMALLLAMAANLGVSTMVSSFRLTFVGYLDQRLASELYLRATTAEQAEDVAAFLDTRVDAVLPIVSVEARIAGRPAQIYGVVDHPTYRETWPILEAVPDVWDRLAAGDGVLINEQLFRRAELSLGEPLPGAAPEDRVLGVYSDYGNPEGQVVLSFEAFSARYPDEPVLRFGVRTDDPDGVMAMLRERFDLPADGVVDQAQIKAFSLDIFERTFAVTRVLNVLTLAVAGLAMFISLLTLATMRLPQLAPVWALGLTRRRLAGLELLRAVALAAFTGFFAIPLGLLLAWVLLAIVNVEAFGWRLPMHIFPMDYVELGILTLVAAILAAFWPATRLARTPPGEVLKVFTHER